ncbi:MAG TPA: polyphosphate kinase 1 [Treponema sp.]|nr:polyphosphate kinase 1 [Treponema sp.]
MEKPKSEYFNRDLSWIDFNARVLEEGLRTETPPLERLKFLTIVSSNFDEFFMVRVAALKRAARSGVGRDPSGLTCEQQLALVAERVRGIVRRQYDCLTKEILPALAKEGLELVRPGFYSPFQMHYLEALFQREVFPTLTPLRVEEDADFPFTGNLRLHAAFLLSKGEAGEAERFAIVQVPSSLERVVWLPREEDGRARWTLLDDVVLTWGYKLFPGYSVKEASLFKVVRDADFAVDEERDDDFVEAMSEVLDGREQSHPVRISVSADSPRLRDELARRLSLGSDDVYEMPGPIDLRSLMDLTQTKGFDKLREPVWKNWWPLGLPEDEPLWETIRARDVMLHLPYESFDPIVRLVQDAAADPQVLAIKATLYRTSGDSPIVRGLEEAARNGKQVTALVELKARFDEGRNIAWAERLEQAGVIVVYGLARLKVHAKACMVVRRETDGVKRYVHLSTGNYNDKTAKLYGDLAIFSANDELAYETSLFFNSITGYSAVHTMRKLVVAPTELKHRIIALIDREAKRSNQEYPGHIIAKMNSLADIDVIDALYRASRAGVKIQLNVRGICMLRPGVAALSENISVISIVDRYLEHARIFYFANGGSEELYLSSADWMPRNLERRVELMFPILQEDLKRRALGILKTYFRDNCRSRTLGSDGVWTLMRPAEGEAPFRAQERIYEAMREEVEAIRGAPRQEFVVRRKPPAARE